MPHSSAPLGGPAVAMQSGAWMNNFHAMPLLWLLPLLGVVGMVLGALALGARKPDPRLVSWRDRLGRHDRHDRRGHVPVPDAFQHHAKVRASQFVDAYAANTRSPGCWVSR